QAGPGRREELAAARWPPPLAEGDPRGHLHRWRRDNQPTSSSRCRLTPTVNNIRRYLLRDLAEALAYADMIARSHPGLDIRCNNPCAPAEQAVADWYYGLCRLQYD